MKPHRLVFLIAITCLAPLAEADAPDAVTKPAVYESIDDIAIGRVFLSPAERQQLDAIRHLTADAASGPADTAAASTATSTAPEGFGYIRAQGKAARVFKDGDFIAAAPGERVLTAVPDGVIVRHKDGAGDETP